MERWTGKVVVVTGASSGIGAILVRKLVEAGMTVVGLARRVQIIEDLAKELQNKPGKLYAVKADLTKAQDIVSAFKWIASKVGPVQVLINNAGVAKKAASLLDGDTNDWKLIMDTNVLGLSVATREAIKMMRAEKLDGHIIHISSLVGNRIVLGTQMYGASKHALSALSELLRGEIREAGLKIKITNIHPGVVDTPMLDTFHESLKDMPKLNPNAIVDAVMYSLGTPPDVQVTQMTVQSVGEMF